MENINNELLEKAKQTKSVEELLALAKENGVEMNEEQAKAYFDQLNPASGEISDDELDNVAGGGCHSGDGRLVVTCDYSCSNWEHEPRYQYLAAIDDYIPIYVSTKHTCQTCKHRTVEHGLWLCNHPANKH